MTDEQIRQAFIKYSFQLPEEDEVSYLDFEAGYKAALASLEKVAVVIECQEYNLEGERPILREVDYYNEEMDKIPSGTPLYRIKDKP